MKGLPVIIRHSNNLGDILAIGLDNGFICFYNTFTFETYLCDACDSKERINSKHESYINTLSPLELANVNSSDLDKIVLEKSEVCVEDM